MFIHLVSPSSMELAGGWLFRSCVSFVPVRCMIIASLTVVAVPLVRLKRISVYNDTYIFEDFKMYFFFWDFGAESISDGHFFLDRLFYMYR